MQLVYQVSASEYTDRQAAEEFARKWFEQPREIEQFEPAHDCCYATFQLVNGVAIYRVEYDPGVRLVSPAVRKIYRL